MRCPPLLLLSLARAGAGQRARIEAELREALFEYPDLHGEQHGDAELRESKSLVNTFPFRQTSHHGEAEQRRPWVGQQQASGRASKQGEDSFSVSFDSVAASQPGAGGKRCVDKLQMVEETVYDEVFILNNDGNICCFYLLCAGDRVQPQLRQAVPHHLRHQLRGAAGGGVRGELPEDLLHPL